MKNTIKFYLYWHHKVLETYHMRVLIGIRHADICQFYVEKLIHRVQGSTDTEE